MLDAPPQACEGLRATSNVLVDFTTYETTGRWGGTAQGAVTGGTSLYHAPGGEDLTLEASNGELHVSGFVPSQGTSGIVMSFDPCVDASGYHILVVTVGGSLDNADFKLLVHTNTDYPIDVANQRGACALTSCETGLSDCKFPAASFSFESAPMLYYLGYEAFTGGAPKSTAGLLPDLVGLELQLTCLSDSDCSVSFTLGSFQLMNL